MRSEHRMENGIEVRAAHTEPRWTRCKGPAEAAKGWGSRVERGEGGARLPGKHDACSRTVSAPFEAFCGCPFSVAVDQSSQSSGGFLRKARNFFLSIAFSYASSGEILAARSSSVMASSSGWLPFFFPTCI